MKHLFGANIVKVLGEYYVIMEPDTLKNCTHGLLGWMNLPRTAIHEKK